MDEEELEVATRSREKTRVVFQDRGRKAERMLHSELISIMNSKNVLCRQLSAELNWVALNETACNLYRIRGNEGRHTHECECIMIVRRPAHPYPTPVTYGASGRVAVVRAVGGANVTRSVARAETFII